MRRVVGDERRMVQRLSGATIGPIRLWTEPDGSPLTASVCDFSVQGVGIVITNAFRSGTRLTIQTARATAQPATINAEVRHATILADGRWLLGCRFTRTLTVDDILALG